MTLAEFTVNLDRLVSTLESQNLLFDRIALALERACPPLPLYSKPYQAQVSDLLDASPAAVSRRADARKELAGTEVQPDSAAFRAKVVEYEAQVREAFGDDAIKELPWNK